MTTSDEKISIMKPVKLFEANDNLAAAQIMDILEENRISSMQKSNGVGGYLNIYAGMSVYGEVIYVDEEDLENAKKILEEWLNLLEENSEVEVEEEVEEQKDFNRFLFRFFAIGVVAVTVVGIIFTLILNLRSLL